MRAFGVCVCVNRSVWRKPYLHPSRRGAVACPPAISSSPSRLTLRGCSQGLLMSNMELGSAAASATILLRCKISSRTGAAWCCAASIVPRPRLASRRARSASRNCITRGGGGGIPIGSGAAVSGDDEPHDDGHHEGEEERALGAHAERGFSLFNHCKLLPICLCWPARTAGRRGA